MIEAEVAMHIREIYQKLTKLFQQKVGEYGLNLGLIYAAIRIQKCPNISQKELAESMRITQGAASTIIKKLINLKMVEQIPLKRDSRYNRLVVTDLGRSIIKEYEDFVAAQFINMFENFGEDELVEFNSVLTRLNYNLDNMSKK